MRVADASSRRARRRRIPPRYPLRRASRLIGRGRPSSSAGRRDPPGSGSPASRIPSNGRRHDAPTPGPVASDRAARCGRGTDPAREPQGRRSAARDCRGAACRPAPGRHRRAAAEGGPGGRPRHLPRRDATARATTRETQEPRGTASGPVERGLSDPTSPARPAEAGRLPGAYRPRNCTRRFSGAFGSMPAIARLSPKPVVCSRAASMPCSALR